MVSVAASEGAGPVEAVAGQSSSGGGSRRSEHVFTDVVFGSS